MTPSEFIEELQTYHHDDVFNPWSGYNSQCDSSAEAPQIRSRQLREYLEQRQHTARYILIAEAAGYQGCRFTGIAITCERMLLNKHKQIPSSLILGHDGLRTSRPDCPFMTSKPQQKDGMNEPTDTYVWGAIAQSRLPVEAVALWNIFPFHPHKPQAPFTNRTPSDEELEAGLAYARKFFSLFPNLKSIGAIGKKSGDTLTAAGFSPVIMRHPANGGAGQFRREFAEWVQSL